MAKKSKKRSQGLLAFRKDVLRYPLLSAEEKLVLSSLLAINYLAVKNCKNSEVPIGYLSHTYGLSVEEAERVLSSLEEKKFVSMELVSQFAKIYRFSLNPDLNVLFKKCLEIGDSVEDEESNEQSSEEVAETE